MLTSREPAKDKIYVSLDLETTGLDTVRDQVIEIGAVKFCSSRVIETFETYVNPYGYIPDFVQRLTGIGQKDVESAPPFAVVAGRLEEFVGSLPIIGHNIPFDLEFLAKHGLSLGNPSYDTLVLSSILLPTSPEYSLPRLAQGLGFKLGMSHRALDDAQTGRQLFLYLLERLGELDQEVLQQISLISGKARWPLADLLSSTRPADTIGTLEGLDLKRLDTRLGEGKTLPKPKVSHPLDEVELVSLLSVDGLLSRSFHGFEYRPQQVEMLSAVTKAFNGGRHLISEAGTGVGKSVAYLTPSILYAVNNGARVVVSTNTINLQEQLIQKDIPTLVEAFEKNGVIPVGEFKGVTLKGRSNYICVRRWRNLARAGALSQEEARLYSKCLIWLQNTSTGDRRELNLIGKERILWNRVSSGEKGRCVGLREGGCFLRTAREQAETAHLIVVNHALLLADLERGGTLIPNYQHLVVDEAHHLEEEATQQLGFRIPQGWLEEQLEDLSRGLSEINSFLLGPSLSDPQKGQTRLLINAIDASFPVLKERWNRFWSMVEELVWNHQRHADGKVQLSINGSTRVQPGWSGLEIGWENCSVVLADIQTHVERFHRYIGMLPSGSQGDFDTLLSNLESWLEDSEELRGRITEVVSAPGRDEHIDWITQEEDSTLVIHSAPLDVGILLKEKLFDQKESVVLTSGTLSTQGNFDFIRHRLGLENAEESLVGSPFDYMNAALLVIPDDVPEPGNRDYRQALEGALTSIVLASEGHTMSLFTSHAALRSARQTLIGAVEPEGITVLAQGIDGPPHRVMRSFTEQPKSVLLGTSSLWEGVDLPGGVLKVLVLARLPFNVPTEPTFAARSEQYEDAFRDYAVPQAVLRFRQGFGRLVRSTRDRGVVVVLDRRVLSRPYGRNFLDSLPDCSFKRGPISSIPEILARWFQKSP